MGDKYATDYASKPQVGGPYNSGFSEVFRVQADSANPATGEKIYYGKVPAGAYVTDVDFGWEDFGTANTINVGWELDGTPASGFIVAVDAAGNNYTANQATYWFSAKDISTSATGGRTASTAHPIKFLFPVKLVGVSTGTVVGTPDSYLAVKGKTDGPK